MSIDFYTELKNAPDIVFFFTEEQQDKFNAVFEEIGNHVGCLDGDIFKKRPFPTIASIIAVIFLRQLNFYYICSVKCENKA